MNASLRGNVCRDNFKIVVSYFLRTFNGFVSLPACRFQRALSVEPFHPLNSLSISLSKSCLFFTSFFSYFFFPLAKAMASLIQRPLV